MHNLNNSYGKRSTRVDKNGEEITKNISHILLLIESVRFMASSLSNLVNNISEAIHRFKCKFWHYYKNVKRKIKCKYCHCFLEYTNFKDKLTEFQCLCCNKNYQHEFYEKLKEPIFNTNKLFNHSNNMFMLLLRKGAFSYEYLNYWEKSNETSLPKKECFYGRLNMEDITDADYTYAKRVL